MRSYLLTLIVAGMAAAAADLDAVRAEPNLEKRSQIALDAAEARIAAAKTAYDADKLDEFRESLESVGQLVELSYNSLDDTGKRARRSPKWFKKAEQRSLTLMRRISNLEKDVSLEDRETVLGLRKRVSGVHDRLLNDIMSKK